jgi:hypothetical protein
MFRLRKRARARVGSFRHKKPSLILPHHHGGREGGRG